MKMQFFRCDYCGKQSESSEQGTGYPYSHGWVYIYHFEFKTSNIDTKKVKDKHFCCSECMNNFIELKLGDKTPPQDIKW